MEELKSKVIAASHLVWGKLDGYGKLPNGWEFNGLMTEEYQWHCYEKQGVQVEFHDQMPAEWLCWKMAAEILEIPLV